MSAFYDIWVSKQVVPQHYRLGNMAWAAKGAYYISSPKAGKTGLVQHYDDTRLHLCVLGLFYESVSLPQLGEACMQYASGKRKDFTEPAGSYLLFLFDKESGQVYVFTDRFGTQHAYYLSSGGRCALSTYFLGLLKSDAQPSLDMNAIGAFMSMGFFPGDKTYSEHIRILNPASCYRFSKDLQLLSVSRYWEWQYSIIGDTVKNNTARLHEALSATMAYTLKDARVSLPLSGGLDSRTLAGVITDNAVHSSLWSYSYGFTENSQEIGIARKIANARNIRFDGCKVPEYLFDRMQTIIDSVELFQYVDGTRQTFMKPYIESNADLVVGGHWGDVWLNDMGLVAIAGKDEKDILMTAFKKKVVKKGSGILGGALSIVGQKDRRDYLESYFSDYIDQYKDVGDADFKMKIFKTDQWSFRWTLASIRAYRTGAIPVLPFYDKRVADVCMRIPKEQLHNRALQVAYLKEYHPDLAKIRWQEYDSTLYRYKYLNNRNLAYRVWKRARRAVSGNKPIVRNADLFYHSAEGKQQLLTILEVGGLEAIIPKPQVKKIWRDYYGNPDAANTYAVSMLHTLAQFLKVYNE